MSYRIGNVTVIEAEDDSRCELCGLVNGETRPYGPKGERVCFECGMKNPEAANRQMNKYLYGEGNV